MAAQVVRVGIGAMPVDSGPARRADAACRPGGLRVALWQGGGIQLTPRYGADPVITLDGPPAGIAGPAVGQRRRLAEAVGAFTAEQWAHPSRCEGWSARDVIVHLDTTNTFWSFSIAQGLAGEPTQFLAAFDPVASPAELVAAAVERSAGEVADRFMASTEALADLLGSIEEGGWSARAEAPPGHLSISAVVHHALWDSWVHERDILLPMGVTPPEEADEIAPCLRYAAALGPALALNRGAPERGVLAIAATAPDLEAVVEVGDHVAVRAAAAKGDLVLRGDAVGLLEALSTRRALDQPVPPGAAWMLAGLAETFDLDAG